MKKSAKEKLKQYYKFFESDFYIENGVEYTICKDNYMELASDVWEDLEMQRKEKYEK